MGAGSCAALAPNNTPFGGAGNLPGFAASIYDLFGRGARKRPTGPGIPCFFRKTGDGSPLSREEVLSEQRKMSRSKTPRRRPSWGSKAPRGRLPEASDHGEGQASPLGALSVFVMRNLGRTGGSSRPCSCTKWRTANGAIASTAKAGKAGFSVTRAFRQRRPKARTRGCHLQASAISVAHLDRSRSQASLDKAGGDIGRFRVG